MPARPIPEPSAAPKPPDVMTYLRVPAAAHRALMDLSAATGVPMGRIAGSLLAETLGVEGGSVPGLRKAVRDWKAAQQ